MGKKSREKRERQMYRSDPAFAALVEGARKKFPKQLVGDNEHLLVYRILGGLDDEAIVDLLSYMQKIAFIFNGRMLFRRDGNDRLLLLSFLGQKEARYAQENIAANWPEGPELEDVPETRGEGFGPMSEGIYPEEIGVQVADRVAKDPDALQVMLEGMLDRPPGDYVFDIPDEVKDRVRAAPEERLKQQRPN
jgi:hypothetical protein